MTQDRTEDAGSRTVLLITYHFPPSPAVGGARIANFAKYLREFGWTPVVLTIADEDLEARDDSRLESLPGVTVLKAKCSATLSDAYLAAKRLVRRRPPVGAAVPAAARASSSSGARESFPAAARRFILSLLLLPDSERRWILPAARRALREVRRRRVSSIVTSCPPYSVHVAGLIVNVLTGTRWIADFRDPWMSGGSKSLYQNSQLSLRIDRWLERQVVRRASVIVANTPKLCASLQKAYPDQPASKFVTLTNSIDLSRLAALWELPKDPVFTITYAGSLYFNRSPEPVFQAVRRLIDEGSVTESGIRVHLVGQCDRVGTTPTEELVRRYGLEKHVSVSPPVPYASALTMIRRSHVALLLAPTQPNQIPAKAYDYIGVGTEILAIAGAGATADLVTGFRVGSVFTETDIEGMTAYLREAARRAPSSSSGSPAGAQAFDARTNTERLARLLEGPAVLHEAGEVTVP